MCSGPFEQPRLLQILCEDVTAVSSVRFQTRAMLELLDVMDRTRQVLGLIFILHKSGCATPSEHCFVALAL